MSSELPARPSDSAAGSWPDREKERMVWAHTVAILSSHLARLGAAGAALAEIMRRHEGGIANRELDEWQAAVAAMRDSEVGQ